MTASESPFLAGARAWIYEDNVPEECPACHYNWSTSASDALDLITQAPSRYSQLLEGRDGMAAASDGGWNATAYVWHLADLARGWSERWVQLQAQPGDLMAGWDPDELADARNYQALPTVAALWAIDNAVATFVEQCSRIAPDTPFQHGDWGEGTVNDAIRWLGHEFFHHQLDVAARAAVKS